MDERTVRGGRMTASLTAMAVALTIGLPVFALGERIRERHLNYPHNSPTRKNVP